jgi:predicted Zn-dependent protease
VLASSCLALACAGGAGGDRQPSEDTLRSVGFDLGFGDTVLLHGSRRQMPLRVHLPPPPEGFYADPEAVHEVVRDGVTDWADAVEPGLPSFAFVDTPRDADIAVAWAFEAPDPTWYVAHCVYSQTIVSKQLAVDRILVTARWRGEEPALDLLSGTMLHEVGHALGLGGHSPAPNDVMGRGARLGRALTERDRNTLRALYAKPNGHRVTGPRRVD